MYKKFFIMLFLKDIRSKDTSFHDENCANVLLVVVIVKYSIVI